MIPNFDFHLSYIKWYGVRDNSITFKLCELSDIAEVVSFKKRVDSGASKNRNIGLLVTTGEWFQDQVCRFDESKLKDIHFYSCSIYDDPLRQCDDKKPRNIHEKVDLFNQEHFMNTINDIVCKKKNGEEKDEL